MAISNEKRYTVLIETQDDDEMEQFEYNDRREALETFHRGVETEGLRKVTLMDHKTKQTFIRK